MIVATSYPKSGIVGEQAGNGAGGEQTVTVLMLQTFAVQSGAPISGAEQKALGLDVTGEPHEVTDALEAEHRIIDVEGNHVDAVGGISRARCDK